jgi:hypothetical protein
MIIEPGQVAVMVKVVVRGGVGPPTFRFSGLGITVRPIPLTFVTCIAEINRTRLNADERRRMRPRMRPPGLSWPLPGTRNTRPPGTPGGIRTVIGPSSVRIDMHAYVEVARGATRQPRLAAAD